MALATLAGCGAPVTGGPVTGGPVASSPVAGSPAAGTTLGRSSPGGWCGGPTVPTRSLTIPAGPATLAALEVGSGARGIVLVPELGRRGLCGWWTYATTLAGRGYHVLLFDHRCTGRSDCPQGADANALLDDISAAVGALHTGRTVLIGASQGASEVVIAAAHPPAGVVGVVALSADELTDPLAAAPYPPTAVAAAPHVRVPSLFAVADQDANVSVVDTQRLVVAVPGPDKALVRLPAGAGHGWDLLDGASRPDADIVAFLSRVLP